MLSLIYPDQINKATDSLYLHSVNHPVILFDGVCNLCNGAVNFVLRHDAKSVFRFATLQSETGQQFLKQYNLPVLDKNSFVLIENGVAYQKSSAALRVMNQLPWYLKGLQFFWIVPPFLRNAVYDFIARNRYKWFGEKETCMVPSPAIKSKFLN